MMRLVLFLALAVCSAALTSSFQLPEVDNVYPSTSKADFDSAWNSFVSETLSAYPSGANGVQDQCKPRKYEPSGSIQGTIVLLHGFTACPQQYDEVVRL